MSNLFGYSITIRFECPFCEHKTEQSGAFTLDTNDDKRIQEMIKSFPRHCEICGRDVPPETELTVVRLERDAKF